MFVNVRIDSSLWVLAVGMYFRNWSWWLISAFVSTFSMRIWNQIFLRAHKGSEKACLNLWQLIPRRPKYSHWQILLVRMTHSESWCHLWRRVILKPFFFKSFSGFKNFSRVNCSIFTTPSMNFVKLRNFRIWRWKRPQRLVTSMWRSIYGKICRSNQSSDWTACHGSVAGLGLG